MNLKRNMNKYMIFSGVTRYIQLCNLHLIGLNLMQFKCVFDVIYILGITYPSGEVQKRLLKEVYSECGVDPSSVVYVEAHGTGTAAGDPQEVNVIADVFCGTNRKTPLLIGSTKSNMGHPEPAAGRYCKQSHLGTFFVNYNYYLFIFSLSVFE